MSEKGREELEGMVERKLKRFVGDVHATFAILIAERGLLDLCGNELCAAEILRPS